MGLEVKEARQIALFCIVGEPERGVQVRSRRPLPTPRITSCPAPTTIAALISNLPDTGFLMLHTGRRPLR